MKKNIKQLLISIGFLPVVEKLRFLILKTFSSGKKKSFIFKYPEVKLPPDWFIYETFKLDYFKYQEGGRKSALSIIRLLNTHRHFSNGDIIFEWGCGPSRLIRHVGNILREEFQINDFQLVASDYNLDYITWNKNHIKGVRFFENSLYPPLNLEKASVNYVYAISIITHLEEKNIINWIKELHRVLKSEGLLLITSMGLEFSAQLTSDRKDDFLNKKKFISTKGGKEGSRIFSTYHHPEKLRVIFTNVGFTIKEHIVGKKYRWGIEQDIWILEKKPTK